MNKTKVIIAIMLVAIMVMGVLFIVPGTNSNQNRQIASTNNILASHNIAVNSKISHTSTVAPTLNRKDEGANLVKEAKQYGLPIKDLFLPNFMSTSNVRNGLITLGYAESPAPMGIGFYGLYNQSGKTVGANYTFPSVAAHVNLSELQTINLADDAPQTVTFQLNSILNNVNLFGNGTYNFWTQNVVDYSARTHQLTFVLNIWNFTNPNAPNSPIMNNVLYYSSQQRTSYPDAIIIVGPTYTITGSGLNLYLYMNTSIVNGRQALWFNYSLPQISKSGTYEEAVFNSTTDAAPLTYLVSGTEMTPTGYIPYDSEIMIGGPGGGSTATVQNISGTMNLMYFNSTIGHFVNVPNAYDIGSETGETSTGVDVHYSGSTAYLTSGPSMVYGLWNETNNTFVQYNGQVKSNGGEPFLFIAQNTKAANKGFWNWAPLGHAGTFHYLLPKSMMYPFEALENYYDISGSNVSYLNVTTSTIINMKANNSMGVYTPIILDGNNAVKSVAISGTGTRSDPYVIDAYSSQINTTFAQLNDYAFPVFPGVFIYNSNVNVTVVNFNMPVSYSGFASIVAGFYGLINTNGLPLWIYNSTNVSVNEGTFVQWYSFQQTGYIEGSLEIWNSTNVNVTENTFNVFGYGAFVYNAPYQTANVTFYQNLFKSMSIVAKVNLTNSFWGSYLEGSQQIGLELSGTGYLIKDNIFLTETPIMSPECNVYTGDTSVSYSDVFLGNYYWNYNGTSPYNNYGLMQTGSDPNPNVLKGITSAFTINVLTTGQDTYYVDVGYLTVELGHANGMYTFTTDSFYLNTTTPYKGYAVSSDNFRCLQEGVMKLNSTKPFTLSPFRSNLTVSETGLPPKTIWTLSYYYYQNISVRDTSVNNPQQITLKTATPVGTMSSNKSSITLTNIAPGYYYVIVNSTSSYAASGYMGFVPIFGNVSNSVTFTHVNMYNLTFTESGLASGTTWSVIVNGMSMSSTGTTITFSDLYAGSYSYYISVPAGYSLSSSSGSVSVNANTNVNVSYTKQMYTIEFQETGLTQGTNWTVTVNGVVYNSTKQDLNVSVPYGTVSYTVGNVTGYLTTDSSGSFLADGNAVVSVLFGVQSSYSDITYITIAVAAIAGVVLGAVVMELFRKK
ncbi:thermopsin family protease [Cuniculiplasma sp. SKW4]|uniref:thermopsin family protease n=1 Tax=Cuniculiplasma sp. SKW4 TaxID=3400171 RepID=UPI003FCF7DA5